MLRPHQQEALDCWIANSKRGVTVLPTGSGKTILAVSAIAAAGRSALILVPTIDLLTQWANVLGSFFDMPIGMLGGGSRNIENVTVSTYDSAVLNMEFIGNRFGLLIADECHLLPAAEYKTASAMCIAPFRLGLTATPEMAPDREAILFDQMGKIVCRKHIDELSGSILSPYAVKTIRTSLSPEEEMRYRMARKLYTDFIRKRRISFNSPEGWKEFMLQSSRSDEGRQAFEAFLEQREIARGGKEKIELLRRIFQEHRGERII
ncbi:MAG: DEAD/DEAH box helicase, partial [Lentisphaeria bacterium]|nr:DEAD/DEAH box helicase [Lentisphaeria bacterium]